MSAMRGAEFGLELLLGENARFLGGSEPLQDYVAFHGPIERLSPLTSVSGLESARSVIRGWDGELRTARAWSPAGVRSLELFATREQLEPLYDAGFNILLENAERFIPGLRPFCRRLDVDLGVSPGSVNVQIFCATQGGQGRPHFDSSFTFNCQLTGRKRWRVARNRFLPFPPRHIGWFLGRPPHPGLDLELLEGPIPSSIEDGDALVAEPGSVVFLPPGVLHETHIESESLAIAFAVENTRCIADEVAQNVRERLRAIPELLAPRLGAQSCDLAREMASVARELRSVAALLEGQDTLAWAATERFRLCEGVQVMPEGNGAVRLRLGDDERVVRLEPAMETTLQLAATPSGFALSDVLRERPDLEPAEARRCIRALLQGGLLQRLR